VPWQELMGTFEVLMGLLGEPVASLEEVAESVVHVDFLR